jgi:FlaA1/EpsC-like NDP-sugar epimerase
VFRLRTLIFLHDLVMVPIAWLGAYWLRFNLGVLPDLELRVSLQCLPIVMLLQATLFRYFGLYRGVWRFASMPDLIKIAKAVLFGILIIAVALFLFNRLKGVPRSVIPLYSVLLLFLLATPRLLYRMYKDQGRVLASGKRTLIVGAGRAGEMLVRDLLRSSDSDFLPVAFVDDDRQKKGRELHHIRVLGACDKIPVLAEKLAIETILIAVPSANDKQMRRIVEICEQCNVPFLTLPSVQDMLSGSVSRQALRDVSIEDLLGRAPVRLQRENIRTHLRDKCILVTGGGGSSGSELCRQIARFPIAKLVVFEKSEFNLYRIQAGLSKSHPELSAVFVLGDVIDSVAVRRLVGAHAPDIIFHAAAYKHVPLLQNQVREAVLNNIMGTRVVAEAAIASGVQEFVLISTDKAVNPNNVMGASKRTAEMLVQSLNEATGTRFIIVRFGNVLDSAGSVVPLFREQIRTGGPVTVTHPAVTRFFMTIPEACQLIMQAAAVGRGGEVFVLDMGEPVRISYLAEQMIRLSGKRPDVDVKIEYIGLRPGEKMQEELFHAQEQLTPTGHSKLLLAQSRQLDRQALAMALECLARACAEFDEPALLRTLQLLLPEAALYEVERTRTALPA